MLRHSAVKEGYKIDSKGFVSIDEIIAKHNSYTMDIIKQIVAADKKNRFELVEINGNNYIRAVQGHTIANINPDLIRINDPADIPIVVHGTNLAAYNMIKDSGLSRMDRSHIHFAHGTLDDTTVISGMRKTANVMIYIDVVSAMTAGIIFYRSLNGVILSDGIDGIIEPKYFSKVDIVG